MKLLFTLWLTAILLCGSAPRAKPATASDFNGLRKLMDTPLRDTSICRGPDGTWYLTGTVEPFWSFNEGIKLWKSPDLTNWTALGFVWKNSRKSALVYQIDRFSVNLNLDRPGIFVSIASSRLVGFPVSAEGLSF